MGHLASFYARISKNEDNRTYVLCQAKATLEQAQSQCDSVKGNELLQTLAQEGTSKTTRGRNLAQIAPLVQDDAGAHDGGGLGPQDAWSEADGDEPHALAGHQLLR